MRIEIAHELFFKVHVVSLRSCYAGDVYKCIHYLIYTVMSAWSQNSEEFTLREKCIIVNNLLAPNRKNNTNSNFLMSVFVIRQWSKS